MKEKVELNASDLDFVDQNLIEAASTGLESAKATMALKVELDKLKYVNRQIDRKLEGTKLCFEKSRSKLKSFD